MLGFHWPELIIVFAVLVLLFGAKRLPEIGSSIGKSVKAFNRGLHEHDEQLPEGQPTTTEDVKE